MMFALVCALLGILLIYLEFFLPGAVMGIGGTILLLVSIFLFILTKPNVFIIIIYIAAILFVLFLVIKLALAHVKKSNKPFFGEKNQDGYMGSIHQKKFYDKEGEAASDLKPAGFIYIDGEYCQAISKKGSIKKGEKILVIGGEGSKLIVKKIETEAK